MKAVAAEFSQPVLRSVPLDDIIGSARTLRGKVGDRAILRAFHEKREDERVEKTVALLKKDDLDAFLRNILASGDSSYKYLQNVYTTKNVSEQGLSLALAVSESYLSDKCAAWRVHGGGFAGTIQAFVPNEHVEGYRKLLDSVFGEGACMVLRIRALGAVRVL